MTQRSDDLFLRLKRYSLRIIKLFVRLPRTDVARTIGKQLLRSGTSAGAHYAEARHGKSDADYLSKMQGGLQELEETGYWLDLLAESEIVVPAQLSDMKKETDELISIFVVIVRKVQSRIKGTHHNNGKPLIPHP